MVFQITSLTIIYSNVYSGADQRQQQSSASLAFVSGIHRYSTQKAINAANVSIWRRHHGRSCTRTASFHAIIVCLARMRYGEIYFTILNISRLRQNGHHCANEIYELIFLLFEFCIDDLKKKPHRTQNLGMIYWTQKCTRRWCKRYNSRLAPNSTYCNIKNWTIETPVRRLLLRKDIC